MIMIHPKSFILAFSRKKCHKGRGHVDHSIICKDIFMSWNNFLPHKISFHVTKLKEGEGKGLERQIKWWWDAQILNISPMHKQETTADLSLSALKNPNSEGRFPAFSFP